MIKSNLERQHIPQRGDTFCKLPIFMSLLAELNASHEAEHMRSEELRKILVKPGFRLWKKKE